MAYLLSFVLICFSALFSGLTLGLMGLNVNHLRRQAELGNTQAQRVYAFRKNGNQLLTSLLLGNVLVNAILSVYLGSIATGIIAVTLATVLIFVFGEILPQAVFSRYALPLGARLAPIVHIICWLTWPIAYPIGKGLDRLLGREMPTMYSKRELMEIVSELEDLPSGPIDRDEERIVHGALQFSTKRTCEVMTPIERVHTIRSDQVLDDAARHTIIERGHSRVPVIHPTTGNVVGVLYTKDILIEPNHSTAYEAAEHTYLRIHPLEMLDTVLAHMLKRKQHLGVVEDADGNLIGVITLEDIIEEVIQQEIVDEDDHVVMVKNGSA